MWTREWPEEEGWYAIYDRYRDVVRVAFFSKEYFQIWGNSSPIRKKYWEEEADENGMVAYEERLVLPDPPEYDND